MPLLTKEQQFFNLIEGIDVKLSEVLTINTSLAGQLSKIESEVTGKLTELQAAVDALQIALTDAPLTDEQAASVQAVVDGVQALDNIVPDPAPTEPVPAPADETTSPADTAPL